MEEDWDEEEEEEESEAEKREKQKREIENTITFALLIAMLLGSIFSGHLISGIALFIFLGIIAVLFGIYGKIFSSMLSFVIIWHFIAKYFILILVGIFGIIGFVILVEAVLDAYEKHLETKTKIAKETEALTTKGKIIEEEDLLRKEKREKLLKILEEIKIINEQRNALANIKSELSILDFYNEEIKDLQNKTDEVKNAVLKDEDFIKLSKYFENKDILKVLENEFIDLYSKIKVDEYIINYAVVKDENFASLIGNIYVYLKGKRIETEKSYKPKYQLFVKADEKHRLFLELALDRVGSFDGNKFLETENFEYAFDEVSIWHLDEALMTGTRITFEYKFGNEILIINGTEYLDYMKHFKERKEEYEKLKIEEEQKKEQEEKEKRIAIRFEKFNEVEIDNAFINKLKEMREEADLFEEERKVSLAKRKAKLEKEKKEYLDGDENG